MLLLYPSKEEAKRISKRNYYRIWRKNNIQKSRRATLKYHKNHPEKARIRSLKYQKLHPQSHKKAQAKWNRTTNGKKSASNHQDKRRRELGNEYLNEWFDGCNRHHINKDQIICIPVELHKKHPHNHKKPETMVEINRIAMQYLFNCKA